MCLPSYVSDKRSGKFSHYFQYSNHTSDVLSYLCPALSDLETMGYLKSMTVSLLAFLTGFAASGQEKIGSGLEIDRMVHNFGEIMVGSGPVSCSFTVKNTGEKPALIYNVATTCGCTDVNWTREPILPGKTGTISVTYSNDEGPYPFDKSVTVYFSGVKKPVVLKLRGVALDKKKPLAELYPVRFGDFALKESVLKCGNLDQGRSKTESVMVANLSQKPIAVSFKDVSPQLSISMTPDPIPPQSTAEMSFTVTADRNLWGKNMYYAVPVVDGKTVTGPQGEERIGIWAFTKENFDDMAESDKMKGPRPMFRESTYSFGKVKRGNKIHASFCFRNEGQSDFRVYKVNTDACCWSHSDIPAAAPGEEVTFRVHLDTANMPLGETLTIVTLTTNSPLRPIVNLFIAGWLE